MSPPREALARKASQRLRNARRVIRARWLALVSMVVFGVLASGVLIAQGKTELLLEHLLLPAGIFGAYVLVNGLLQLCSERIGQRVDLHALQVFADLLLITAMVHDSGGAQSWIWPLYAFLVLEAAVLFESQRRAWLVAIAGAALYGTLLWLELVGVLQTRPTPFVEGEPSSTAGYVILLVLWVSALKTRRRRHRRLPRP